MTIVKLQEGESIRGNIVGKVSHGTAVEVDGEEFLVLAAEDHLVLDIRHLRGGKVDVHAILEPNGLW